MDIVLLIARLGLSAVFLVAGTAKLADLAGSRRAVEDFGVPARFADAAGTLLPVLEIVLAILLIPLGTVRYAAVGLTVLSAGFVAVIAGWIPTEVGRQPYTVYGLLRTADSASPLAAPAVGASLVAFVVIYFAVFGAGTWYILKLMAQRPKSGEAGVEAEPGPTRTAGITPASALEGGQ